MITLQHNKFLDKQTCLNLIEKFKLYKHKTIKFKNRFLLRLNDVNDVLFYEIKKHYDKFFLNILNDSYLRNIEIVYWSKGEYHSEHIDTPYYDHTVITNLNDEYIGGRTFIKNEEVQPYVGKMIMFDSNIPHSVSEVLDGERYTLMVWYNRNNNKN